MCVCVCASSRGEASLLSFYYKRGVVNTVPLPFHILFEIYNDENLSLQIAFEKFMSYCYVNFYMAGNL